MRLCGLLLALASVLSAQSPNVIDFSDYKATTPWKRGPKPGHCSEGNIYYDTGDRKLMQCTATDTWSDFPNTVTTSHVAYGNSGKVDDTSLLYPSSPSVAVVIEELFTSTVPDWYTGLEVYTKSNPTGNINYVYGIDNEVVSTSGNTRTFNTMYGQYNSLTHKGSGHGVYMYGYYSMTSNSGPGLIDWAYGAYADVAINGAGNIGSAWGAEFDVINGSGGGRIIKGYGVETSYSNFNAVTTDAFYGMYVAAPTMGAGAALLANYAYYNENQAGVSGVTSSYAWYSAGGHNYLATGGTNVVGMTIDGANGQTANLQNWKVNGGTVSSVTKGGIYVNSVDTMTYASAITLDVTLAGVHKTTTVNATGNATINASAAGTAGQEMTVLVINDGTSGKTITYGTNFKPTNGSTVVGTTDKAHTTKWLSDGASWWEMSRTLLL